MKQRIFISTPGDYGLSDGMINFKWELIRHIESKGYIPEVFHAENNIEHCEAGDLGWSFENMKLIISKCSGAIILALKRKDIDSASEYINIEGWEFLHREIPLMIIADVSLPRRGILYQGNGIYINYIEQKSDFTGSYFRNDASIQNRLHRFLGKLQNQKTVFVGYCSSAERLFQSLASFLQNNEISFINWKIDFAESSTILEQIQEASRRSLLGIFLFTKDDMKHDGVFLPRDNVLFEAGFFTHSKGKSNVLIIKEEGTKMPSDLDGLIHIAIEKDQGFDGVQEKVLKWIKGKV